MACITRSKQKPKNKLMPLEEISSSGEDALEVSVNQAEQGSRNLLRAKSVQKQNDESTTLGEKEKESNIDGVEGDNCFNCNDCGQWFYSSKDELIEHISKVHTAKDKPCEESNMPQTSPDEYHELRPQTLEEAMLLVEEKWEIMCGISGKSFVINMIDIRVQSPIGGFFRERDRINYKFLKPLICNKDSSYTCNVCKTAVYSKRDSIVKHVGNHFSLYPFSCSYCEKRYTLFSHANEHLKTHLTSVVCEECGCKLSSSEQYYKHKRSHTKPFTCNDCGKRYTSKISMEGHILTVHLSTRNYSCELCGKSYFYASNVSTHRIFAHADKKIECDLCGKMYYRKNMLLDHIRKRHQ